MDARSGRQRDALEIVRYKKAALVGRLLLGQLDGPMESISVEQFLGKPRKELISEREALRTSLRGEIAKFCRNNFENMEPEDLAKLYDVLFEHHSEWFLPYAEFEREFGRFKPGVLKGAPLHSTIRISPWGLQTEFPEHHLIRDLAVSLNEAIDVEEHRLTPYRTKSWQQQKEHRTRPEIADLIRRRNANLRACVLSCFNLIEAYVNGYDKLSKLYDLNLRTVREAVEVTIALIKSIHQFVDGASELPPWFLPRAADGEFVLLPGE